MSYACSWYKDVRAKHTAKYIQEPYTVHTTVNLLQTENYDVMYNIGLFLYHVNNILNCNSAMYTY